LWFEGFVAARVPAGLRLRNQLGKLMDDVAQESAKQITLDFNLLWPNFSALYDTVFAGSVWSTQAFSAAIVGLLLFVCGGFLLRVLRLSRCRS
jgi:hypothetical protein